MAYRRRKRRFKSRFKPKRRRSPRRKASGMKVKHKQWATGALAITAFFVAMPQVFSQILARIRGGA